MPYDPPERTVFVKPGQSVRGKTGEKLTIILLSPRCIVDGHSHIENGACAPLPLLWEQILLHPHFERKTLDILAKIIKPAAGFLQVKSTTEIGYRFTREMDAAFGPASAIGRSGFYKNTELFAFAVIQMMDMEYAGLMGFHGQTIYHEDETVWYYYQRRNGKDPEKSGKKVRLPGENQKTFSKWKKQYSQTVEAIKLNPLRLFGMYHYDPRRWNYPKTKDLDCNFEKGPWDYPFREIINENGNGLFIGFKMYPPLGYKPLDERLPYLHTAQKDGDCFYGRCEREGIPILAHCSPGGMFTHEMEFYMHHDGKARGPAVDEAMPEATAERLSAPEAYFWTNYVHPRAWRDVLVRFPKLRLCLAHFGGNEWEKGLDSDWITEIIALTKEYANVYTDFSCWDLDDYKENFARVLINKQYSHLKQKILFGTDWYMTLVALGGKSYTEFCEEFWELFREIPGGEDLWQRFTFINPFTFYGFFEKKEGAKGDKLDNFVSALEKKECDKNKLNDGFDSLRLIQKAYEKINSQEWKQS